jgi:hypothetical protein
MMKRTPARTRVPSSRAVPAMNVTWGSVSETGSLAGVGLDAAVRSEGGETTAVVDSNVGSFARLPARFMRAKYHTMQGFLQGPCDDFLGDFFAGAAAGSL